MPENPTLKRGLDATEEPEPKKSKGVSLDTKESNSVPVSADSKEETTSDIELKTNSNADEVEENVKDQAKADEDKSKVDEETSGATQETKSEAPKSKTNDAHVEHKPVFGSTSKFGNASIFDKMKDRPSIFDSKPEETKASESKFGSSSSSFGGSFGSSFGANSKFSNAFENSTKKKSFLDMPEEKQEETNSDTSTGTPKSTQQYKQIDLQAQEVKTGEENEKSIFSATAKLFELDLTNISGGWKERGLGPLHLNQSLDDPSQIRLVMRSQGLLRVILNYKITPSTTFIKGLEASLAPGKYTRINYVSSEGKLIQYLIKFANQNLRDELLEQVDALKKTMKETKEGEGKTVTEEKEATTKK
ncbi:putative ran-specific GTPase-activating protein [Clavispora lusitaniae]|uniref:RanBD1 domain-containing protein n=2 Tax=Clavispora lusitaniae TaxID=36911 RepID=C4Y4M4_CLAL4|nr:uncharacterized protein CLUG_02596 [Clavispora lusitaniae ATCC 42720]KAF7580141.1 RanBP1 domain family protein [Clavispora lusitaniae]EEQ38470.1 hypothetical protein CLUG_02596 [Clavispora lusitaniae ATCC 42720]QFZ27702.1 putative ran-specific GTPase-activating protein [Clavispora lusitaniae]QFZ32991.1 putative ran-specific GTPase-activating protein [Clavispora lusitaniae]QFZ38661.1 putative ran-specific GTPase-activating protein [Clavispora lusitaniae]